jgi:acyl-CoA synthetase (AMP-forming)/AMP-acid ligase II
MIVEPSLLSLIGAKDVHGPSDFIADESGTVALAALAQGVGASGGVAHLRGKAVLLALRRQMDAVAALILLDGVARRIILWPHDETIADLGATMAITGAEAAITTWPPAESDIASNDAAPDSDETAATEWVLFTSGSTGTPKMVVHTLQSLGGHLIGRQVPGGARPIWCTFYDIRRYGGMQILLRALLGGGSLVLSSPEETPAAFLARAAAAGATHFLGTPSHWRRVLMTPEHALIAPRYVRLSGEVAHQAILDQLRAAYPDAALVHAFASTEAGLGFEVTDGLAGFPAALLDKPASGVEVRVIDGTLRLRSTRIAGRLLNRGDAQVAGDDGFVDTGDAVVLQGDRYVFAGRRDGVINVGGQKVHPEEVEAVINAHPRVQMSLVRARRNAITGAIVVADIVARAEAEAMPAGQLEEDVKALCRARLAPHKIPAAIRLVPQLTIAPSGKLVRPHA